MALTQLRNTSLQFILFGGKGGVGKTTMAVATALEMAKEKKVLLFTTDPAPSLTDNFGQVIGNKPTAIVGTNNLFAMEINSRKVMEEFKETYARDILGILEESTYLSKEETEKLFSLDLPGMDELVSLKKIIDFMESSDYELYIVDTAPTGHTLRLLLLPELLDNWIKFFATLRWKYRAVARAFGGNQIEKADKYVLNMKKSVKQVRALLLNSQKTEFVAVTTPEKSATSETGDLLRSLERMRIPSRHIIINNVVPQEAPGSAEQWDRRIGRGPRTPVTIPFINAPIGFRQTLDYNQMRRRTQERYINELKEKFSTHIITEVLSQPTEIQGFDTLQRLGTHLFSETGVFENKLVTYS
jgi:arsenite/tail-anchored protein-transporting ATPase